MPRPMWTMLKKVSGRTSLHMPAAQGRSPFTHITPYRLDTTELPITDDLYHPTGAIAQAQQLAAVSARAAATILLHGGSTAGIHAMLLYACKRGGKVILPRNAHISVLNLCATAGIEPVFASPSATKEGRVYTTAQAYAEAMDKHADATAVLALHSDYYGLCQDVKAIAAEAHARGKLLLCDEAHGAYFNWRKDIANAGSYGADLFVQSAHKTLPALTPAAWLHAMPGINANRLLVIVRMVQTSSPSFITMLSLDDAREWMDRHGVQACNRLGNAVARFHEQAACLGYSDGQQEPPQGLCYDRLRVVLKAPQGGECLQAELAKHGVDVEMCDPEHIVCILSLLDGSKRLRKLLSVLRRLKPVQSAYHHGDRPRLYPIKWPARSMPIWEAAFADTEDVPLQQATGRVSGANVGCYPPGVAWLTPGDVITPEIVQLIQSTADERLFGMAGAGTLRCVHSSTLPA